jgi:hypothetical protein
MYRILGFQQVVGSIAMATALVGLVLVWLSWPLTLPEAWRTISGTAGTIGMLLLLVGETPLFPWLCQATLLGRVFPPISGRWAGTVESNWPVIAERSRYAATSPAPLGAVRVEVEISARLSSIHIDLRSAESYTTSETMLVGVHRGPGNGRVRLTYVYQAATVQPVQGDADSHHGAGYVDLEEEGGWPVRLVGNYWTNRKWHEGLNTAGAVRLRKEG